jgi:hypothetical protein
MDKEQPKEIKKPPEARVKSFASRLKIREEVQENPARFKARVVGTLSMANCW